MVSVCMATKNGERYIAQQLESILGQLKAGDELIMTDDASEDATVDIARSFADRRVKVLTSPRARGICNAFENSLRAATGDVIFLADQDDVWHARKVAIMTEHLRTADLVVSDCQLVDVNLVPWHHSFFEKNRSGRGLLKNLIRNSYMGCCMAFRRKLMERALPFPKDIPVHDFWIGLIAECYFNVRFIPDRLVFHRRHFANASTTGGRSLQSLPQKFFHRYRIVKNLLLHRAYAD